MQRLLRLLSRKKRPKVTTSSSTSVSSSNDVVRPSEYALLDGLSDFQEKYFSSYLREINDIKNTKSSYRNITRDYETLITQKSIEIEDELSKVFTKYGIDEGSLSKPVQLMVESIRKQLYDDISEPAIPKIAAKIQELSTIDRGNIEFEDPNYYSPQDTTAAEQAELDDYEFSPRQLKLLEEFMGNGEPQIGPRPTLNESMDDDQDPEFSPRQLKLLEELIREDRPSAKPQATSRSTQRIATKQSSTAVGSQSQTTTSYTPNESRLYEELIDLRKKYFKDYQTEIIKDYTESKVEVVFTEINNLFEKYNIKQEQAPSEIMKLSTELTSRLMEDASIASKKQSELNNKRRLPEGPSKYQEMIDARRNDPKYPAEYKKIVDKAKIDLIYLENMERAQINSDKEQALEISISRVVIDELRINNRGNVYSDLLDDYTTGQYFGPTVKDQMGLPALFRKEYVKFSENHIVNAIGNINQSGIKVHTEVNRFFQDESKNSAMVVIYPGSGHFVTVKKFGDKFYVNDNLRNEYGIESNNAKRIKEDLIKLGADPEAVVLTDRPLLQQDSISCGPYSVYDFDRSFFKSAGIDPSKSDERTFNSKMQIATYGLHLSNEVLKDMLKPDSSKPYTQGATENLNTQIKFETSVEIARAQEKLVKKAMQYQQKDPVKFNEAYLAYVAETKAIYAKKILEIHPNSPELTNYVKKYENTMKDKARISSNSQTISL